MTTTNRRDLSTRALRGAVAALAALALVLAPLATTPAWAGDPREDARARYQAGKARFDAGDYKGAIAEFAAADALAPSPLLQFNIALSYERLGDKAEAVRRYKLYVAAMPDAPNRAAVDEKIKKLEAELAAAEAARRGADQPMEPQFDAPAPAPAPSPTPAPAPSPGDAAPSPTPPPLGQSAAPTGDPELDRVAGIDVRAVRDDRRARGQIGGPAMNAGGGFAAASPTGGPSDPQGAGMAPAGATPPPEQPAARPVYKQWWFWVIVGVGGLILLDIATSDPDDDPAARALRFGAPGTNPAAQPGGAVLLRF